MMKILITGTDGYIGKSILNSLTDWKWVIYKPENSYDITYINRKVCDLVDSDQVRTFFEGKYFDVVIHCAAVGGSRLFKESRKIFKSNIRMFENLLSQKDNYGKLIHFGSGAQFVDPLTDYGQSKKIIADTIESQDNFYNLIIWGLFDENELDTRFIKSNIKRCLNNEKMVIHKDKYMDFFHMTDLVNIIVKYIETDSEKLLKTFECKYEETYRLTHIAEMISLILGKTAKIEVLEDGLDKPYASDSKTTYTFAKFEDRLKETIEKLK